MFLSDLAIKSQEADALEESSRVKLNSLRTLLRDRGAYFAQAEIFAFLKSNRRQFTPLNVARAMAGLPHVTARVSCELCAKNGFNSVHGFEFEKFRTIERVVSEPIRDSGRSIDAMREDLLNGPRDYLPHAAQLRKNWYFLESAIRSAASNTTAKRGSLAFRIFAEYSLTSTSYSAAEAVLAQANRLIKDGEET